MQRQLARASLLVISFAVLALPSSVHADTESTSTVHPSDVSIHTLAIGDRTLAYFSVGSGTPVVIIHGVGGHKEDWAGVARALSKKHRVFAIDMLGFGASSKNGDDLSMPVQAGAIKALLDSHGLKKVDIVGNSVGGWVAATFAATYPDLVHRLILIDAAGFKAMFEAPPPVNFDPNSAQEMQKLIDITINSNVSKTPGFAQRAYDGYVATGEKAISATWNKSLFISPRLEDLFPRIKAPTLVLWGADDKLFPSVLAGVFGAQIAGSTTQLIPNAGHFPHIDNPQATTAAIAEFLK